MLRSAGLLLLVASLTIATLSAKAADPTAPARKKIVLIAGKKSHGPEGNRIHDYPWSVRLLKVMLDNSNIADQITVEMHFDGWPADQSTIEDADTIMIISDGRDGDKFSPAPHQESDERVAFVEQQMKRGCGIVTFHFSTFAPDKYGEKMLNWGGGYFDWEDNGVRNWYSAIRTLPEDTKVELPHADHPVCRGVKPFTMKEEYYYNIRFKENDAALTPLLSVPSLGGRPANGNVVAWAKQRDASLGNGRGFGTTCGHFYDNWQNDNFRKLILNAIAWTAHVDVPPGGVEARYYEHDEITAALAGVVGSKRAIAQAPIKALILTGDDGPFHPWQKKTPVLKAALEQDPRFHVTVTENIEDLSKVKPGDYDVLLLNYCNWEKPAGLSDASKAAFVKYLNAGGGLVIVHFSNGAWHFSLPKAEASDWPEYRKICRRVWDHKGGSQHDAYGSFHVDLAAIKHPITDGLSAWETTDELYFNQRGDEPIEPLITAVSKVSGKAEPLAWAYTYGDGRVFQTLLGHDDKSLAAGGTAQLIRRGAVWAAKREQRAIGRCDVSLGAAPAAAAAPATELRWADSITAAHGKALASGLVVQGDAAHRTLPVTVEAWCKIASNGGFNILVASDVKASPTHWEIYSYARSGAFSLYMPGRGGEYKSSVDICDGKWHHVAAAIEVNRVRLYVDGKLALDKPAPKVSVEHKGLAGLAFGRLVEGGIGCDGVIDDVRLSKSARTIDGIPSGPLKKDADTIGLWDFNDPAVLKPIAIVTPSPAAHPTPAAALPPGERRIQIDSKRDDDHFFGFNEADAADGRWNQTDTGPFFSSSLRCPENAGLVLKAISLKLGDKGEAAMCFDATDLRMAAGWSGGFIHTDATRFGLVGMPAIAGQAGFHTRNGDGWRKDGSAATRRYRGLRLHGRMVELMYDVDGVAVSEAPWCVNAGDHIVFTRTIRVAPSNKALAVHVCEPGPRVTVTGPPGSVEVTTAAGAPVTLVIAPHTGPITFGVAIDPAGGKSDFDLAGATAEVVKHLRSDAPRWGDALVTQGVRAADDGPYVIDTLTMPYDNPYKAMLFASGHDFFSDTHAKQTGFDAALCTLHGDVWLVGGIDGDLKQLRWKRYATGLFQPLGLRIVDDKVYVLGRDQITRLHDTNGDHEADYYECFTNAIATSGAGHDFVTCLETDSKGNFYYVDPRGLHRVSPDGARHDTIATGWRNPNGMSIGPNDAITVAPQEGNWTPASNICLVKPDGYYGFGGPHDGYNAPLGYDAPLCYIPRAIDNSSGGQAWVTSDRWGPLQGQLLHFSFGWSSMMLVLRDEVDGQWQGGVVPLPGRFLSGVTRGRFNPRDGQLYVTGSTGWVTNAAYDGCFQRVRYTGKPVNLPIRMSAAEDGIALTFTQPLDRAAACNSENWSITAWNYRYSGDYGSKHYSPSNRRRIGEDVIDISEVTLSEDGRSVMLAIDGLQPVMQMQIRYRLKAREGEAFEGSVYPTIHRLHESK